MKMVFSLLVLCIGTSAFVQSELFGLLQGTWKVEGQEMYERWDQLSPDLLKGFSYKLKDGQMAVSEYLDISRRPDGIYYTAAVLKQNNGKSVDFRLSATDSSFVFENPTHDFPKKIVYKKINSSEVLVQVSDGKGKGFGYKMKKQGVKALVPDSTIANPNYDSALAKKLGADDYGMKSYVLVILKTGNNKTTDKEFISNSFRGHMENINRLVEEKKLIVAGPLGKNENTYRGIFILDQVATIEEARELLQTDPAIKSGLLDFEIYKWYGSAALPEYLYFSDRIWKRNP